MRSFSCRTHSMLLINCSFRYWKDLLLISFILLLTRSISFRTQCGIMNWCGHIVFSPAKNISRCISFILHIMRSFSCRTRSMLLLNCSFLSFKDLLLYFINLHLMRSFSCRTHSILLSNCSFLYNKVLLLYFIYFFFHEVFFRYNPFYVIIKLFFPLLQIFAILLHLFHVSLSLFYAEMILLYYQIVLSSSTKIYFFISDTSHLLWFISCRIESILLSNCCFLCYKDLPLWCIYFTSY